ncbi:MAG: YIP1 family protein [Halobacteriales archaeon]
MTSWVDDPGGGRDRGPRGLARAWLEVLFRPRRFFRSGVAPGDQGPGLTFAIAVVAIEEAVRLALVPAAIPALAGGRLASAAVLVGLAALLVTPAMLHLLAAIQTLLLRPLVEERAGVSETVQVLGYAIAPCVLAGIPVPALRVLCAAYGTWLLVFGLAVVHETDGLRAALAGLLPAAAVFGYGFRGVLAAQQLLAGGYGF